MIGQFDLKSEANFLRSGYKHMFWRPKHGMHFSFYHYVHYNKNQQADCVKEKFQTEE